MSRHLELQGAKFAIVIGSRGALLGGIDMHRWVTGGKRCKAAECNPSQPPRRGRAHPCPQA